MTTIDVEFQDVPIRLGENGFEIGDGNKIISDFSFTASVEASSRDDWVVDDIMVWEIGSMRSSIVHYVIDKSSELFRDLKYWLETDRKAVESITDAVSVVILDSGEIVGGEPGSRHIDAGVRI